MRRFVESENIEEGEVASPGSRIDAFDGVTVLEDVEGAIDVVEVAALFGGRVAAGHEDHGWLSSDVDNLDVSTLDGAVGVDLRHLSARGAATLLLLLHLLLFRFEERVGDGNWLSVDLARFAIDDGDGIAVIGDVSANGVSGIRRNSNELGDGAVKTRFVRCECRIFVDFLLREQTIVEHPIGDARDRGSHYGGLILSIGDDVEEIVVVRMDMFVVVVVVMMIVMFIMFMMLNILMNLMSQKMVIIKFTLIDFATTLFIFRE